MQTNRSTPEQNRNERIEQWKRYPFDIINENMKLKEQLKERDDLIKSMDGLIRSMNGCGGWYLTERQEKLIGEIVNAN